MRKIRRFELHVTGSKYPALMNVPDLRGVAGWQNLLRRLVFVVKLDRIQISKSQYRHFHKPGDVAVAVYQY